MEGTTETAPDGSASETKTDLGLIEKAMFIIGANGAIFLFLDYGGHSVSRAYRAGLDDPLGWFAILLWGSSSLASAAAAGLALVALGFDSMRAVRLIRVGAGYLGCAVLAAGVLFLDGWLANRSTLDRIIVLIPIGLAALAIAYPFVTGRSGRRARLARQEHDKRR
jgi:hypothetical protein